MALFIFVLTLGNYMSNNSQIFFIASSGTFMQCAGVTILFIILNNNMLSLKNTTIFAELMKWSQEFPFFKRSVNAAPICGAVTLSSVGSVYAFGTKKGDTIEERVNILEKEIDVLRKQVIDSKEELLNKIYQKELESNNKFKYVDDEFKKFHKKLEAVIIGDYRWQIFSAFIIFLGLILTMISIYIPSISNIIS
jgi:hypothetical protein